MPRGFSLVELIVVIGIIVLILVLAMPAFNKMVQGSNLAQGNNMVSAYIAAARAAAMQQKRTVALIFYEEVANGGTAYTGQTAVIMAREIALDTNYATNGVSYFGVLPGRTPEYLPQGIKVATLSDSATGTFRTADTTTAGAGLCRAIVFNANGQLILRGGLALSDGVTTTTPFIPQAYVAATVYSLNQMVTSGGLTYLSLQSANTGNTVATSPTWWAQVTWNFNTTVTAGVVTAGTQSTSSPGVLLYDSTDYLNWLNSQASPTDATKATWLQQHGDLLIANTYSGGVIR